MDPVQALQDLDDLVVFGGAHGFADHEAVLDCGAPGDAGGLTCGGGGEGLVGSEQVL